MVYYSNIYQRRIDEQLFCKQRPRTIQQRIVPS